MSLARCTLMMACLAFCSCSVTRPDAMVAHHHAPSPAPPAAQTMVAAQADDFPVAQASHDAVVASRPAPPSPSTTPAHATTHNGYVPRQHAHDDPHSGMLPPAYQAPHGPMIGPFGVQARDEYLFDGGDRNDRTLIGVDWSVRGLDLEDTVVHFDTLEGDRRVEASNRVPIYAPRFAAIRRVRGINMDKKYEHFSHMAETQLIEQQNESVSSINAHQHNQPIAQVGRKISNVFLDQTRGLTVENPMPVAQFHNNFAVHEDFHLIRFGTMEGSQKARLAAAIQAAEAWEHHLPVQAVVDNEKVGVTREATPPLSNTAYEDKESRPKIRIIKVASRAEAQPGDIVEFTLRFDNIGNELIGNVTLLDNLTPRLEYIAESAQCDLDFEFFTTENEGGSQLLRFEITDPLDVGEGGIVRFKCRVR